MIVHGVTVSGLQQQRAVECMQRAPFTCAELSAEIDHPYAWRVADRLIQRHRKAKNIEFDGKRWTWVGPR